MKTTPTVENAVAWFGEHTVTYHLDVSDCVAASIINTLTAKGSTVRFYNADGHEFMTLKSDDVSKRFDSLFDVDDAELMSMTVDCSADDSRFGFTLDHDVEKVAVLLNPEWGSLSFIIRRWFEEGLDERSVVLPTKASVELRSEVGAVSVIDVTHTDVDKITSFFEDETSEEPWLVIIETD